MGTYQYFSQNFAEAQSKFRAACRLANTKAKRYIHPGKGPDGGELSVEAAWFGSRKAEKLLILSSGVHGTEGLAGSGCQVGWIAEGHYQDLPSDVAVLIVHILNCHGAAYMEYQTDGFVDLNCNFHDFNQPIPANPGYDDIHDAFCCSELTGSKRTEADAFLAEYRSQVGEAAYWDAVWLGQDKYPDGFAYIGTKPTWSCLTMLEILDEYAGQAKQVCLIDTHTAMGPYGYACMWCRDPGENDKKLKLAQNWFGDPLDTVMECVGYSAFGATPGSATNTKGRSEMPVSKGKLFAGISRVLSKAEVIPLTVEFGSSAGQEKMMSVLRANRWLKFHGDRDSETGRNIQNASLQGFYPCSPDWTDMVRPHWQRIVTQAIHGLAGNAGY